MATFLGREWTKRELLAYVGQMEQLASIRPMQADDGRARGSRVLQVDTGGGLSFRVMADRALDIGHAVFKGISLAWSSPSGEAHPSYYEAQNAGWLRSFQGGLMTTCGLDQFGAPGNDEGEEFGLHGRISNLPAQNVNYRAYWKDDEYLLEIGGEVRQARLFGENLVLRRRILTSLGATSFRVEDTVTNEGFEPQPHMILYHCNLGFPLVSEGARIYLEAEGTFPRDAEAEEGLSNWNVLQPPTAGYQEQVFRHKLATNDDGVSWVQLDNREVFLSLHLSYSSYSLPHLFQWKMMGQGAYVLGLEPANSSAIEGRAVARQRNDLQVLEPGENRSYWLKFSVLEGF